MPPRGSSSRRPVFHALTLAIGFIGGGALTQVAVTPSAGPVTLDLVILKFSLGPVALDVSLLSLLGVLIAYLIARSLF
jgi:hypothetical protein